VHQVTVLAMSVGATLLWAIFILIRHGDRYVRALHDSKAELELADPELHGDQLERLLDIDEEAQSLGYLWEDAYIYRATPENRVIMAVWRRQSLDEFICKYCAVSESKGARQVSLAVDCVTVFDEWNSLTTCDNSDAALFPTMDGAFRQYVRRTSLGDQLDAHRRAGDEIMSRHRLSVRAAGEPYVEMVRRGVARQMDWVMNIPLWQFRFPWWYFRRKLRARTEPWRSTRPATA